MPSSFNQRKSPDPEDRFQGSPYAFYRLCGSFLGSVNAKNTPTALNSGADCLCSVNISNALTLHLPEDLHLRGTQRNVALTIFFVPYVLFEIPSNILLKRFQPRIWRMSA